MNEISNLKQKVIDFEFDSYLELVFSYQYHLIGRVIIKFLSGREICILRIAYSENVCKLILNDSFFLFRQKIKPYLPKQAANIWTLIIEKTVLDLRSTKPQLSRFNDERLCNIFFNLADAIFFHETILKGVFRQPIIILILYQSRGGASLIYQLDHFLSSKDKRAFYNCYNKSTLPPIHMAAKFNLLEIFKIFIPYVTLRNRKVRYSNESVFTVASKHGSYKILKFLRSYSSRDFKNEFNVQLHWFY